jgi:hypothetical protein
MNTMVILIIAGAAALILILIGLSLEMSNKKPQSASTTIPHGGGGAGSRMLTIMLVSMGVVAVGGGGYYFSQHTEKKIVKREYGEDIAGLCAHIDGSASTSHMPAGNPPYGVVVMTADAERHDWHEDLASDIRADNRAETDIVACVTELRYQKIEDCPYVDARGSSDTIKLFVRREHLYYDVVLMNAETDQPIISFAVWGTMPEPCPDFTRGSTGDLKEIRGTTPQFETFEYQLAQVVR